MEEVFEDLNGVGSCLLIHLVLYHVFAADYLLQRLIELILRVIRLWSLLLVLLLVSESSYRSLPGNE